MMATTHAFVGAALASATLLVAPDAAPAAVLAGFCGGLAPDFDVLWIHRRTLHFPVYAPLLAAGLIIVALIVPTTTTIVVTAFAVGFAAHPVTDVLGGSRELRPWQRTTDRAVFSHYHDTWVDARRWIRYDGAPEDFAITGFASLPMLFVVDGLPRDVAVSGLLVSAGYVLVRKRLHRLLAVLDDLLPDRVTTLFPDRDQ